MFPFCTFWKKKSHVPVCSVETQVYNYYFCMWDVVLVLVAQYLQNSRFVAPFGYLLLYEQILFNAKLSKHVNSLLCHEENQPNCTYWLVKQKENLKIVLFLFSAQAVRMCVQLKSCVFVFFLF